jgi:hypothetical protein
MPIFIKFFSDPTCAVCPAAKQSVDIAKEALNATLLLYENSYTTDKPDLEKYGEYREGVPRIVVIVDNKVIYNKVGGVSSQELITAVNLAASGFDQNGEPTYGADLPEVTILGAKMRSWFTQNWLYLLLLVVASVGLYYAYKALSKPKATNKDNGGSKPKPADYTGPWREKVGNYAKEKGIPYSQAMKALAKPKT